MNVPGQHEWQVQVWGIYRDVAGTCLVALNVRFAAGNVAVARHRSLPMTSEAPGPGHYYKLAWTCRLNRQIECGIDRLVGWIVYPDWFVESNVVWSTLFILIGMWNRQLQLLGHDHSVHDQATGSYLQGA